MLADKSSNWSYEDCSPVAINDTTLTPEQKSLAASVGATTIIGRILSGDKVVALVSGKVTIPLVSPPRIGINVSRYELDNLLALVG